MPEHAQVIIIGAGIIGASIAYHLAARGCTDVVILEKEPTEVSGSTARSAAGVRHQFSSPTNIMLSKYSIERFKHFTEEVGGYAELHQYGYLFLFDDMQRWEAYQETIELQRILGVPVQALIPGQAAQFVPEMHVDDLVGAAYCGEDGFVDPHGIAMGYLNNARSKGVRLIRNCEVTGFEIHAGQVQTIHTTQGAWTCETLVNAAGPYAGELAALAGLEVPIKPYRRNIYVTEPFPLIPRTMPLTVDTSGAYMRKEGENLLLGLSRKDEPPSHSTSVDWDWLDTLLEALLHRFPILERAGLSERQSWAGSYEITPDHMPVLGRMPNVTNWINAGGFSGHGVMHAPATGMLMAEEILDGRAHTIPIDDLRIERFQTGDLTAEQNVI